MNEGPCKAVCNADALETARDWFRSQRDEARKERDAAIGRAERAERDLNEWAAKLARESARGRRKP